MSRPLKMDGTLQRTAEEGKAIVCVLISHLSANSRSHHVGGRVMTSVCCCKGLLVVYRVSDVRIHTTAPG